jgi:hypothetical protein
MLSKVVMRKKNFFFDTDKLIQRCRQLRLAIETWEDHTNLAEADIAGDKLVRQNLQTLEGHLNINEVI